MPSVNLYPIVSEDMGPSGGKYDESLSIIATHYSHPKIGVLSTSNSTTLVSRADCGQPRCRMWRGSADYRLYHRVLFGFWHWHFFFWCWFFLLAFCWLFIGFSGTSQFCMPDLSPRFGCELAEPSLRLRPCLRR